MANAGKISVVMITHKPKLREVMRFADEVTVLRRGRRVGYSLVPDISAQRIAALMVGDSTPQEPLERIAPVLKGEPALEVRHLEVLGDNGLPAVRGLSIAVQPGEIVGIAGVSGNGQKELVQAIGGQRPVESGEILVHRRVFHPSRNAIRESGLFTLPEEPLQNATVPGMSVAEKLALRNFDTSPVASARFLLNRRVMWNASKAAIRKFSIRPPDPNAPIRSLSGGNVQRTVLARDLGSGEARIVVVSNPCYGLDFAATAFVHNRLVELCNQGGSVLLASEDLDELMKLADRIVVMSEGAIVHETLRQDLDLAIIGRHMGGHAA